MGVAKFAVNGALSLGKAALDIMDYTTSDIQGEKADSRCFFVRLDAREAAESNTPAIMGVVGGEQQAKCADGTERGYE